MSFSINTNIGSLNALQTLNDTFRRKEANQTAINTGLKVSSPKDSAAAFSIAQNIKSQLAAHSALQASLKRKLGLLEVTLNGTNMINDMLQKMKELAVAAADPGLDQASRNSLQQDFEADKKLIDTIAAGSEIYGHNLLDSRDSNFLTYGADQAKIGATQRTKWEPQPGENVDLGFTFTGSGKNSEEVNGKVSFYWRSSSDGGNNWDAPQLIDTVTIPDHQTVSNSGTPYTIKPSVPFTAPKVPGANAYQIYAEWQGHWPGGDDGIDFNDTLANGTQHTILSWSEYNSQDAQFYAPSPAGVYQPPQVAVDSYNGIDVVPGDGTANQTDAGDNFDVGMKIINPADGITTFGANVNLYYEWKDEDGNWQRYPTPLDNKTVATGPVNPSSTTTIWTTDQGQPYTNDYLNATKSYIDLADLNFSGTLPTVSGGIQEARIVADVQAQHDGDLVPDTTTVRQSNLDYQVSDYEEPYQVSHYGLTASQIADVSNTISPTSGALDFKASVKVDNPDPSVTNFDGTATAYVEYFDGSTWNRLSPPLDSDTQSGGNSSTPLSFDFDMSLRDIPSDAKGIRIAADFDMNQNGVAQPTETKTIAQWDGSTLSTQPTTSTTLLSWSEQANNSPTTSTAEYASKIDWLDDASGYNRPLRESNLGTSGLYGLFLSNKTLSTTADAQTTVKAIEKAMDKVNHLSSYYASEYTRTSNMLGFETSLSDTMETGIGNLVDADMAKESAKQQALQVREQLGLQALSIANNASELILGLFRK